MQDDQDNGESPALDTLEIWNGSSTAESATDEPLATRSAAYDFSGDDSADSGAYQPPLDDDARDSRTFQVAGHGVALSPVPPAPIRSSRSSRAKHTDSAAARTGDDRFTLRDFAIWCGTPILIVLLVRIFLVGFYEIPSRSMMDTFVPGDRVMTSKIFNLQRGDVVVFKDPNNWLNEEQSNAIGGGFLIKRLIGMPGDMVECKGAGQPITINGVEIDESSYIRPGVEPSAFPFSVTVTEGHVFVMGDNRSNSADSRYHQNDNDHGLVPIGDVVGTGLAIYWPINHIGLLASHHDVFKDVPDVSSGSAS